MEHFKDLVGVGHLFSAVVLRSRRRWSTRWGDTFAAMRLSPMV